MQKIYISYSRQDLKTAKEVSALLLQCGYKTFLDIEDFPPGSAYAQHLISQLKSSDLVIFIVSEASLNSQWCQREIDYALSIGKGILPIAVSHNILYGTDSEYYHSRLSSLTMLVWDPQGKRELPDLLRSILQPIVNASRPSSAPPIPRSKKNAGSSKGWFRKYGFIAMFILLLALLVFYALRPVGSSSDMTIPDESAEPSEVEIIPGFDDDYGYPDSSVVDDTVICVAPEIVEAPVSASENPHESPDIVASMIPEEDYDPAIADSMFADPGYFDSEAYEPSTDAEYNQDSSSEIFGQEDDVRSSKEDSSDGSLWWLILMILLIGGGTYWHYKKKKFRIKVVANIDCQLFVDNKKVASLKAKTVSFVFLRKGKYYLLFRPINENIKERNITLLTTRNDELIDMEFKVKPENDMKTIKCFIAGSTHLEASRNALRAGIAQTHNNWRGSNFEILSYTYEDFVKQAVDEGHQNLYDEFIENEATLAVFIISGEIGEYTVNEFEKAMNAFKHRKHPQVLVFNDKNATAHEQSERLKRTVAAHKQYWSDFESLNDLKLQFMHTLDWMLIEMFLQ